MYDTPLELPPCEESVAVDEKISLSSSLRWIEEADYAVSSELSLEYMREVFVEELPAKESLIESPNR